METGGLPDTAVLPPPDKKATEPGGNHRLPSVPGRLPVHDCLRAFRSGKERRDDENRTYPAARLAAGRQYKSIQTTATMKTDIQKDFIQQRLKILIFILESQSDTR